VYLSGIVNIFYQREVLNKCAARIIILVVNVIYIRWFCIWPGAS